MIRGLEDELRRREDESRYFEKKIETIREEMVNTRNLSQVNFKQNQRHLKSENQNKDMEIE